MKANAVDGRRSSASELRSNCWLQLIVCSLSAASAAACGPMPAKLGYAEAEADGPAIPIVASCADGQRDGGDGSCVEQGQCSPGFERIGDRCGGWVRLASTLHPLGSYASATTLLDGRILLLGADGGAEQLTHTVQIYDPVQGHVRRIFAAGKPTQVQSSTLLTDGRVLIVAGWTRSVVEIFDPSDETFHAVSEPPISLWEHTAHELPDGRIVFIVTLGLRTRSEDIGDTQPVFFYDPRIDTWTAAESPQVPKARHFSVALSDGSVLLLDGSLSLGDVEPAAELFDIASERWEPIAGPSLPDGPAYASTRPEGAARLSDGRVFVFGGSRAMLYDPAGDPTADRWEHIFEHDTQRSHATLHAISTGHVLIAGGAAGQERPERSLLFDPAMKYWFEGGVLHEPRRLHVAAPYEDGTGVMSVIFGGFADEGKGEFATDVVEAYVLR